MFGWLNWLLLYLHLLLHLDLQLLLCHFQKLLLNMLLSLMYVMDFNFFFINKLTLYITYIGCSSTSSHVSIPSTFTSTSSCSFAISGNCSSTCNSSSNITYRYSGSYGCSTTAWWEMDATNAECLAEWAASSTAAPVGWGRRGTSKVVWTQRLNV